MNETDVWIIMVCAIGLVAFISTFMYIYFFNVVGEKMTYTL